MIITISGNAASGKSTVSEALAKMLGYKHYSTGDFMRALAKRKGVSLQDLGRRAERNFNIDKKIDNWTIKLGKTNDNFIIDSRLAWHFIPNSVKIYLHVHKKEQLRRLMLDQKLQRRTAEMFKNKRDAAMKVIKREKSEYKRYKAYYGIDYNSKKHYDLWLETDKMTIQSCAKKIKRVIERWEKQLICTKINCV